MLSTVKDILAEGRTTILWHAKGRGLSQYPRPHQKEENHFALLWAPNPLS
jgi:hypothetical protein